MMCGLNVNDLLAIARSQSIKTAAVTMYLNKNKTKTQRFSFIFNETKVALLRAQILIPNHFIMARALHSNPIRIQ